MAYIKDLIDKTKKEKSEKKHETPKAEPAKKASESSKVPATQPEDVLSELKKTQTTPEPRLPAPLPRKEEELKPAPSSQESDLSKELAKQGKQEREPEPEPEREQLSDKERRRGAEERELLSDLPAPKNTQKVSAQSSDSESLEDTLASLRKARGGEELEEESESSTSPIAESVERRVRELREEKEQELQEQQSSWFETTKKELVDKYDGVEVYKIEGDSLLFYKAAIKRPTEAQRRIINTIREAATRLIAVEPYEIKDPEQRKNVYVNKVLDIIESAGSEIMIPPSKRRYYAEQVVKDMIGFGYLDELLKDDSIEDILVIGANKPVYIFHRDYEMMKTNLVFSDDESIVEVIDKIGRTIGRRIDRAEPLLDARLPDGSRVNATIPPISIGGPTISIRKFRSDPYSIVDLLNMGTLNLDLAAFLWVASDGLNVRPANVLISGGTGSGKTTLLNMMCSMVPDNERVLSIEDTAELQLPIDHWIRFEKRLPSLEGTGEISMAALVKNALRMRPDRIIVGEVRGEEADTLFTAMNTGHDGSMGTLHANSALETRVRITSPPMSVPEPMLSGLDLIIVLQRIHLKGKGTIRRVVEVAEITGVLQGESKTNVIYKWSPGPDKIEKTPLKSAYLEKLKEFTGMNDLQIQEELQRRKDVLTDMKKQGLRTVPETSNRAKQYLNSSIGEAMLDAKLDRAEEKRQ